MPFLALLAGFGFAVLCEKTQRLLRPRLAPLVAAGLGLFVLTPALLEVLRSHPYGPSHYNALAGGPAGAADLGMNRQFWGYAVRGLFPYINEHAPQGCGIYWHDANLYMLQMSEKDGLLRHDLRDTGLEEPG